MSHRLFICCCKGFFRDENRDELYHLLDVDRRSTAVEIKRAYRTKSLQMHPDKLHQRGQEVTAEDRANFQRMKGAYDVLSDPQKRELYDQLGETGMMMMEDPFSAKENMVKNFLKMNTRDRLRLVVFVLLFVGAVLVWPILFCSKVDGDMSSSWVALWTPLWIYDALGLYYYLYLVSLGEIKAPEGMEEHWTDPFPLPVRLLSLVKWILLVLFQIFLTMRLDGDISWTWIEVGSPLLAWLSIQLLQHLYEATRPIPESRPNESILEEEEGDMMPDVEKREQAVAKRTEARTASVQDCACVVQLVLIGLQVDGEVDWNWWVIFIPTWALLFGKLVTYGVDYSLAKSLTAGIADNNEEDLSQEEKARMMTASQLIGQATSSCCCWVFTLVTVILAVDSIAGADYSTFVIFIPQFVIAGLLVCCLTCLICGMRMDLDETTAGSRGGVDPERGQGVISSPQHVQPSYGTYNPPPVESTAAATGSKAAGGPGTGAAPRTVVLPMPAPASTDVPVLPTPPPARRPSPVSTPAPESQADGGID